MVIDHASNIPKTFAAQTWTARHLISLLGIFAIFYLKLYEGGLLTSLLNEQEILPFKDIYELTSLVAAGNAVYMFTTGYYQGYMEDPKIKALDGMREAVKNNPYRLVLTPEDAVKEVSYLFYSTMYIFLFLYAGMCST